MSVRIGSILGSYDLFAKTIPGVAFFIGVVSLFPSFPEIPDQEIGFGFITVVIIVTVVSGFVIGQGLHSVAVAVESLGYRFAEFMYNITKFVRREYWSEREGISYTVLEYNDKESDNHVLRGILAFILRIPARVYCWVIARIHEILLPHRVWFKFRLRREFEEKEDPDGLYEWFKWECRDHLQSMDMNLVEQHEKVYRFVMSYLEFIKGGRARQFQATSSFCRSMWITLLAFSFVYFGALVIDPVQILGYEPAIQSVLIKYGYKIPIILCIGSIIFMYSAGQYKKHFTEYIVVDFYNAEGSDANTSGMSLEVDQLEVEVNDQQ